MHWNSFWKIWLNRCDFGWNWTARVRFTLQVIFILIKDNNTFLLQISIALSQRKIILNLADSQKILAKRLFREENIVECLSNHKTRRDCSDHHPTILMQFYHSLLCWINIYLSRWKGDVKLVTRIWKSPRQIYYLYLQSVYGEYLLKCSTEPSSIFNQSKREEQLWKWIQRLWGDAHPSSD